MVSENLQSPNAIPPRTSSTGLNIGFVSAAKPVLRPVPEADWISHGKKLHTTSTAAPPPNISKPVSTGMSAHTVGDGTMWSAEKEKIVLGPYDYLFDQPGKDIRKQFITVFNAWLKVPEKSIAIITKVIGMLHTASLLLESHLIRSNGSC